MEILRTSETAGQVKRFTHALHNILLHGPLRRPRRRRPQLPEHKLSGTATHQIDCNSDPSPPSFSSPATFLGYFATLAAKKADTVGQRA